MPTIYKANSDRINIADAKRLILEALPVSSEVWGVVSGHLGEDGEPEWDIESLESESAADATESCIHQDFMKICQRLGFEPHLILSPARGGYIASEANDKLYMLTHAEFVQVADSYSLPVAIGTAPEQADTQPQPAPVVQAPDSETPEQRRARWLDWYAKGERGAVQRVYERERLLNPKADRAYIGKQIKIAKAELADKKRGGAWVSQLVQDGKR